MALMGRPESGGGGGTELADGRSSLRASEAGGRASRRVTDVKSVQFLFGRSGLGGGVGYDILHLSRIRVFKLRDNIVRVQRDVWQCKLPLQLREPHGRLFGPERRDANTDAVDRNS